MSLPPAATAPEGKAAELLNYETHGKVFEQVTAFHGQIATTVNLYLLASAGIWGFVLSSTARLGLGVVMAALILHILISLGAASVCFGLAETVRQRLDFLQRLGLRYWPSVEDVGKETAAMQWRWQLREQAGIWFLIPFLGAAASFVLIVLMVCQDRTNESLCAHRLRAIETATTAVELDRATFLYGDAGCGSHGVSR